MIDEQSRHYSLEEVECQLPDGRFIRYKQPRLLPDVRRIPLAGETVVKHGDRLDTIAARALGNAEHFWKLCDANNVMNSWMLNLPSDDRLRVPLPHAFGGTGEEP